MRVLVTAATRYGASAEIAQTIAEVLGERGLEPTVLPPEQVEEVDGYDAVVLGSAVYAGHWLKPARELVGRCDSALATTRAREHRVFAGKLLRRQLSFPERAIVSALRVPEGDFREWPEIRRWATGIASALKEKPTAPTRRSVWPAGRATRRRSGPGPGRCPVRRGR